MISAWKKAHPVVEEARVVDDGATWDYFIDVGDKTDTEKGKGKKNVEISPEDVAKHEKIAAEIFDKLKPELEVKSGETGEELLSRLELEVDKITPFYAAQLKEGIGLFVDLDLKDSGDYILLNILIKPNDTDKSHQLLPRVDNKYTFDLFDQYIEMALNLVTDDIYKGENKPATHRDDPNFDEAKENKIDSARGFPGAVDSASESSEIAKAEQDKILELEKELKSPIEKIIAQIQNKYHLAFKAEHNGNNIMAVAGVRLFIDQARNFYVYPLSSVNTPHIRDVRNRITLEHEVSGYDYKSSNSSINQWVLLIDDLIKDSSYVDSDQDKIAFMVGGLAAEPHRYPPNHVTNLIALTRAKLEGGSGNAVNELKLVGAKDPVSTGEIKGRLRNDRLEVIRSNSVLFEKIKQIWDSYINYDSGTISPGYTLDGNQNKPSNPKQFRLVDAIRKAIIDYIRNS